MASSSKRTGPDPMPMPKKKQRPHVEQHIDSGTVTVVGQSATLVSQTHGIVILHARPAHLRRLRGGYPNAVWVCKWSVREGNYFIVQLKVEDEEHDAVDLCPTCGP